MFYLIYLFIISRFVNPNKEYPEFSQFYYSNILRVTRELIRWGRVKIEITGAEKVPDGKCLFVSNHRSNYDPLLVWHIFKKNRPAFISKEGNFHIPIVGRMLRKCCFLTIDRDNPRQSLMCLMKAAEYLKEDKVSIGIYPEGTRNKNYEKGLLPFHNGVFKIAKMAKVPIVVLTVEGTQNIHTNFPWHKTPVKINVAEVIETEEVCSHKTDEIAAKVRKVIYDDIYPELEDTPISAE